MYKLLLIATSATALQPRPQKTLEALKTSRRGLLGLAGVLVAPAANAATSAELKAMMGGLQSELSDENLAKARGVAQKDDGGGFGIELPSVKAPSFAPKEGKPKPKPKAKQASSAAPEVQRIEVPDVAGGFGDFGAAQREAGRKRAEAMRNRAFSPEREKEEMKPAPADSSEVASGAVYDELRAKREAQRAAMEAREEQRKFNRLTPAEQAKYRAAGKAPKGK